MQFHGTEVAGCWLIEATPHADERGAFARIYCPEEFAAAGITDFTPVQSNLSRNRAVHTLRGMHFQPAPYAEAKLIRVVRGAVFDVVIDLRTDSPTYLKWAGCRLDADGMTALYAPEGCAHGFLSLEPDTDVLYMMGRMFTPGQGQGVRWDDPAFGVKWPAQPTVISERDAHYPDFQDTGAAPS
ncbi:MAG: dTDP-4-dehydrorhamnose 3,5-epimerase family protein [Neomegalonema sp.]|nr:dTDP-4-dehydrorhamnose 3,5-epimerase family protein [Neomegalonema sp.]